MNKNLTIVLRLIFFSVSFEECLTKVNLEFLLSAGLVPILIPWIFGNKVTFILIVFSSYNFFFVVIYDFPLYL